MNWNTSNKVLRGALFTGLLSMSAQLPAQSPPPPAATGPQGNVMFFRAAEGAAVGAMTAGPPGGMQVEDRVVIVGPMGMMGGGVVKGVPYSATATTEMTQQLPDGNRIRHSNSSKTYRDSEGRTRRDQTMPAIGPFAGASAPNLSFINDPVAKVTYVLNHTEKTARKMPAPQWIQGDEASGGVAPAMPALPLPPLPGPGGAAGVRVFARHVERPANAGEGSSALPENVRREDLGKKLIDGIEVEGTRIVMTIAAGAIGNELPIEVVTEEWRSPVLQVMLSSKHSDPRMGENTYQLTGISRAEPDASLFQVPADYKLVEGGGPAVFNLPVPPPKP